MAGADFLILIAFIVVSVTVGRPVSYLNCYHPPATESGEIFNDIMSNLNQPGSLLSLQDWSGLNKSNCFATKTIWGFSISLAYVLPFSRS